MSILLIHRDLTHIDTPPCDIPLFRPPIPRGRAIAIQFPTKETCPNQHSRATRLQCTAPRYKSIFTKPSRTRGQCKKTNQKPSQTRGRRKKCRTKGPSCHIIRGPETNRAPGQILTTYEVPKRKGIQIPRHSSYFPHRGFSLGLTRPGQPRIQSVGPRADVEYGCAGMDLVPGNL